MNELSKHLRSINFILIALSVGIVVFVISTKEPWAERGLSELLEIKAFLKTQETGTYGKFGTLWLKRWLQKEYGTLEWGPTQGKVLSPKKKELDCFGFFHLSFPGCLLDKTTLNSPNAHLIEKVLSSSKPIETISQWKEIWDGIFYSKGNLYWVENVLDSKSEIVVVNHRPEYRRSAFGTKGFGSLLEVVKGAKPSNNFKWIWGACEKTPSMIDSRFVFLRPSANHVVDSYSHAYWALLFDNPDAQMRFDKKRPWNDDAYYFLHIPVQIKKIEIDLQKSIAKEANAKWQYGLFEESFPGLNEIFAHYTDIPFEDAEFVLKRILNLERRSGRSFRFVGFEISGTPFFSVALFILLASQLYFIIHFIYYFGKGLDEKDSFPWIALYKSRLARYVFLISCACPTVASLSVLIKFGGKIVIVAMVANTILSLMTIMIFLKRPINIYNKVLKWLL